ncbi:hypothetical protein ACO2Q1_04045 [Brevundimonas sp. VNH65]|uniref:hypothetical protein n=1 Tax=Brevundimonas sp. VNH65 TaxID=3400917 RepID=UPI003C00D93B
MRGTLIAVTVAAAALAACSSRTKAPTDAGVCYSVTLPEAGAKGEPEFHVVARDQPQIEHCAAQLEQMRLRFLRMGGSRRDLVGAYQGRFIFIDRAGVYFGQSLEGTRFFALARTGDGRLAVPGAIQREATPEAPATPPAE